MMHPDTPLKDSKKTNRDLSIRSIVFILIYFILIGLAGLWANGVSVETPGPHFMHQGQDGTAYVEIGTHLYHLSDSGELIADIDLSKMGIDHVFNIHFIDKDTILVRKGAFDRGLIGNIASFLRLPNSKPANTSGKDSGLFKCSLQAYACKQFSQYDPGDVHWLAYDSKNGNVYVSDTSRHQIHLLDSNGKVVATEKDEFIFPNQILLIDGVLTVVDTNHKQIKTIKSTEEDFGQLIDKFDPITGAMRKIGQRWPYMMLPVDDEVWLMIMRSGMSHGGIYRYNKDWKYQGKLKLPTNMDASYLAAIGDQVWLSDYEGNNIYRFDREGTALGKIVSSDLEKKFETNQENRSSYQQIAMVFVWIFGVSIMIGVIAGLWVEWKRGSILGPEKIENVEVNLKDPSIQWLQKSKVIKRYTYFLGFILGLLFLMVAVSVMSRLAATTKEVSFLPFLLPLVFVVLFVFLIPLILNRQRLGVLKDVVIIQAGKKYKAARGENIFFSGNIIAIDGSFLTLGGNMLKHYMMEDMVKHLNPAISNATILETRDMGAYQFYKIISAMLRLFSRKYLYKTLVVLFLVVIGIAGINLVADRLSNNTVKDNQASEKQKVRPIEKPKE